MISNVLQLLEKCEEKYPGNPALEDEEGIITYAEYAAKARKIGTYLAQKYSAHEGCRPIAVLIGRNAKSIYSFAGVVYGGGFYVPIDMSMPEERIKKIFSSLNPLAIIDARDKAEEMEGAISVDEIIQNTEEDFILLKRIREKAIDLDPLYAIYTSGTTGVPKGVLISHRGVIDLAESFEEAFHFEVGTVFGNQAPFDFDVSTKDIYNALFCGGCVSVIPHRCFVTPKLLGKFLLDKKINTIIWAVSALRIIGDYKIFDNMEQLPQLKNIMFSGEVMPVKTLNYWRERIPGARFVNLYGPTEITCNCLYHILEKDREYADKIPIGRPFQNSRVFLMNEALERVDAAGQVGEICVEGSCLALGYWDDREKTSKAFPELDSTAEYRRTIYRTGDMGYYDEDGLLFFASRRDHQIKHMGHRIELGEIEAALNSIPFLTISACIYDEKNQKIVCYYQADEECKKNIVKELAKKIPKFMWPNVYCFTEKMPMTKNGKIDRVYLNNKWEKENGEIDSNFRRNQTGC